LPYLRNLYKNLCGMDIKPFQKLKFKVHDVPQGTDLLHKFPELGAIKEFRDYKEADRNHIIRYIIYAYDPESDFIENFKEDILQRKEASLIEAGFNRNKKDEFDIYLKDIMDLKNDKVTDMIFAFLRNLNIKIWMMIISTEEMFLEYQRLIMRPITFDEVKDPETKEITFKEKEKDILAAADMKKKLREECNAMYQDLKKYYKEFFGSNNDLEEENKRKKRITPETIKFVSH
jgi:hypothetical protein